MTIVIRQNETMYGLQDGTNLGSTTEPVYIIFDDSTRLKRYERGFKTREELSRLIADILEHSDSRMFYCENDAERLVQVFP